ncbi:MAG: Transaldolase [Sodalis sp.]|nr:MAG: Transaldolase [Sodalis sp.]
MPVRKICDYYKQHRYQTDIIGASFRKVKQILALVDCDPPEHFHAMLENCAKAIGALSVNCLPQKVFISRRASSQLKPNPEELLAAKL